MDSVLAGRERTWPAFAQQHYRNLHVYFRWVDAEGERLKIFNAGGY